jgi:hypothetical protein
MTPAFTRALTCDACGAPIDLGMPARELRCESCRAEVSLEARGLARLSAYTVPQVPGVAEAVLRQAAAESGLTLGEVEAHLTTASFFARSARVHAISFCPLEIKEGVQTYYEDRFINWELEGRVGTALEAVAPAPWSFVPPSQPCERAGDVVLEHPELWSKNFDTLLRQAIGSDLEHAARAQGWHSERASVTVEAWGEPFVLQVAFVWLRFTVLAPRVGRVLFPPPPVGGYSICCTPDGRLGKGALPRAKLHPALPWVLLAGAALVVLGALALVVVFVISSS